MNSKFRVKMVKVYSKEDVKFDGVGSPLNYFLQGREIIFKFLTD